MRPRIATAFHLDRHSELGTHHANSAFVLGMDALAPIPLIFDRLVDHLKLDTANKHLAVSVAVPVRVDPKRHHHAVLCVF